MSDCGSATMAKYRYGALVLEENESNAASVPPITRCEYVSQSIGFNILLKLEKDAYLLILCKVIRLFSYGFKAVILVVYLSELKFSMNEIGLLFTLTLFGDALISIILTSHADQWGRRLTLLIGSFLSIFTGIVFTTQSNFYVLLISAIIGVISPSGKEVGPFTALELSSLSQVSDSKNRTMVLAWYNMFGNFAIAFGGLFCGLLATFLNEKKHFTLLKTYQSLMFLYSFLQFILFILCFMLSHKIEIHKPVHQKQLHHHSKEEEALSIVDSRKNTKIVINNPVTLFMGLHKSKRIVLKLSFLFMLDSFAGGFIIQSLVSNWFYMKFGTAHETLGTIVFTTNIVAGISALFAAKLADYIGLIMTMVVTHLPSNIMLLLMPFMPNETFTIVLLTLRFCISQMDVPTRNAYVQGVVDPDERSAANGITNVVRSMGSSTGPYLACFLYASPATQDFPWFIAGSLKILYDILILISFQRIKPESEKMIVDEKKEFVENEIEITNHRSINQHNTLPPPSNSLHRHERIAMV